MNITNYTFNEAKSPIPGTLFLSVDSEFLVAAFWRSMYMLSSLLACLVESLNSKNSSNNKYEVW